MGYTVYGDLSIIHPKSYPIELLKGNCRVQGLGVRVGKGQRRHLRRPYILIYHKDLTPDSGLLENRPQLT